AVVLAHEQHWQLPQRSDVQRLEAHALFQRAVAEEGGADRAVLLLLASIAAADPQADAAADDARRGEEAEIGIAEMDGAAAAAVEPGGAAEDLGHGAAGIAAARQHVAMVSVGGVEAVA